MTGHINPLTTLDGRSIDARHVNALFGFPGGKKVPALFTGVSFYQGHSITCLPSQPDRKHRMMTLCPVCGKWLTVGCLRQHMKRMHGPRVRPAAEIAYWEDLRAKANAARLFCERRARAYEGAAS
jgi:hypothetical protein